MMTTVQRHVSKNPKSLTLMISQLQRVMKMSLNLSQHYLHVSWMIGAHGEAVASRALITPMMSALGLCFKNQFFLYLAVKLITLSEPVLETVMSVMIVSVMTI